MCGRFALAQPPEIARATFGYDDKPWFPPRYNIAPTQPIGIVVAERSPGGSRRRFELVRWGFVPAFVKDFATARPTFNAWADGLPDQPAFRNAFRRRRCLVMADGYYVWQAQGRGSHPWLVRRADRRPFGMAGLKEGWAGADGSEIDTVCIVTAAADGAFAGLHPRRPVIVSSDAFAAWLDPDELHARDAAALLDHRPAEDFEAVPVGPLVSKAANDTAEVQIPTGPAIPFPTDRRPGRRDPQGELF